MWTWRRRLGRWFYKPGNARDCPGLWGFAGIVIKKKFSFRVLRRDQSCWHIDFRPLTSTIVRKHSCFTGFKPPTWCCFAMAALANEYGMHGLTPHLTEAQKSYGECPRPHSCHTAGMESTMGPFWSQAHALDLIHNPAMSYLSRSGERSNATGLGSGWCAVSTLLLLH